MKKIVLIISLFTVISTFAQNDIIVGEKFDFSAKFDQNPQLVLKDNYNHFLASVINADGIQATHRFEVRKFDQKNNLVDTFSHNFAIDIQTLHNNHGIYELDENKVGVIIESYSGKRKISEIFSYIFDKKSGTFTSKLIASFPILSAYKSGTVIASKSQNGRYISVIYQKVNSKKEPEESECFLLNANTFETIWQKTTTFQDEYYSTFRTVTNNGKIIFVREPRSYKETNYLVVIDSKTQENKPIEENFKIHQPISVSIGDKDYLIAFNYKNKGLRRGDFGYIMFYDLEQGKALFNNEVEGFSLNNMKEVLFSNVFIENNEIRVFAEGKIKAEAPKAAPGEFNRTFFDEKYNYGPAKILIFSNEGELKKQVKIETNDNNKEANLYHSFGMFNNKGQYYINTGMFHINTSTYYGFYKLNPSANFESTTLNLNLINGDYSFRSVNQLMFFNSDTNKVLFTRTTSDNKMFFISIPLTK
jgi:hypothetical protein